jgi:hypothetical protein
LYLRVISATMAVSHHMGQAARKGALRSGSV